MKCTECKSENTKVKSTFCNHWVRKCFDCGHEFEQKKPKKKATKKQTSFLQRILGR